MCVGVMVWVRRGLSAVSGWGSLYFSSLLCLSTGVAVDVVVIVWV